MEAWSGIRMGQRSKRLAAVAGLCCAALAWSAAPVAAAPGDLTYDGCLTGDTAVGPAGTNACALLAGANAGGVNNGFDFTFAVAISPNGASLYAVSQFDDAIAHFSRNPSTGALTYQGCITGETASGSTGVGGSGACTEIPSHQTNGTNSGFDTPYGIAISPNGASVYVTAVDDDSVAHFQRNTGTGALTYVGCFTGELASGNDVGGNSSCAAIPSDTAGGDNSGLEKARAIAIDPNGETVYASGPADDSVTRFTRAAGTGVLTYQDCFTAEAATGSTGTMACTDVPGITAFGSNSGMDNPQALRASPSGAHLYVASGNDASITRFNRTAGTGALSYQTCDTGDSSVVPAATCSATAGATPDGVNSGLDNLRAVVMSQNGASLYTIAGGDASIVQFDRDTGTGALTFVDCITGDSIVGPDGTDKCTSQISTATTNGDQSGWGIAGPAPTLAINPAGTGVYFGASGDRSVVQLDRNTTSGQLTPRRCLTSETESVNAVCTAISPAASFGAGTALNAVNSLALSPDGSSLYVAAPFSDAVASFSFEPAPVVPAPTPPPTPKKKCKKKKKKKGKAGAAKKCKKKGKKKKK